MRPTALSVPSFADLLQSAVTEPGIISAAYSQFHTYSMGNQLLAWVQCLQREIPPGPIATFPRWKELGRHVKKGEKALMLCMPVTRIVVLSAKIPRARTLFGSIASARSQSWNPCSDSRRLGP